MCYQKLRGFSPSAIVWIAKTNPWLISPDGHRIDLEVHGNIPFLRVGSVSAAAVSNMAPKCLSTPDKPTEKEEWKVQPALVPYPPKPCAPAKEKVGHRCTSARSALSSKVSVILLDSDEESETPVDIVSNLYVSDESSDMS